MAIIHTKHVFTTPYRPQCNGKNEKLNGTLSRAIKKLTHNDPDYWDLYLHSVLFAHRTKVHKKTKLSPYQMMYGMEPSDVEDNPITELGNQLGFERYAKLVDRNSLTEVINALKPLTSSLDFEIHPLLLQPGDFLIEKRQKKNSILESAFEPEIFKVITTFNNNTYKVADLSVKTLQRALNYNNIKEYFFRDSPN